MFVNWHGAKFEARQCSLYPRNVRRGDFILTKSGLAQVITVQRDCESINKNGHPFTAITCITREGSLLLERSGGRQNVLRVK